VAERTQLNKLAIRLLSHQRGVVDSRGVDSINVACHAATFFYRSS